MPKSVGARTQPCLTPLRISTGSEELPLNCTVPFVSVWKHSIMLCSLCGQPIFGTRSNALVRSMKAMHKGICCGRHGVLSGIEVRIAFHPFGAPMRIVQDEKKLFWDGNEVLIQYSRHRRRPCTLAWCNVNETEMDAQ